MIRRIIKIDEDKCTGCGICAMACHEGAIKIEKGKAKLIRDDYCDGLGDCLPACPTGAISFEEREALPYNEEAVKANIASKTKLPCGCPGSMEQSIKRATSDEGSCVTVGTQLINWPVQIKLASPAASYFKGAELLVAADCTAYAYGNFHNKFMKGRVTLIGCPKLDGVDYYSKIKDILTENDIRSVTVVRMEVPCCGGIESAVKRALADSGKFIPWRIVTISTRGKIIK